MKTISGFITAALVATLVLGCGKKEPPAPAEAPAPAVEAAAPQAAAKAPPPDFIVDAIADDTRLADARMRDAFRKPAEVLVFSGIRRGDTVVEIAPGGGYYTALLSRVVGPEGKVLAIDSDRLFEYMPRLREGFTSYIEQDPRENVQYSVQRLDELDVPQGVDQVWVVLFYHDTIWMGLDRAAMNRTFFEHLRPGGSLIVIDHSSLPGADESVAKELHRVDAASVEREIEAAGFVLAEKSDALVNPDDPRTDSIFDEGRRGRTDQFVWRFVRPVD
jgi:predicted methyltransferase